MNNIKRFDSFNEKKETQNYMFFSNLENLKKMVDELSTMDRSESKFNRNFE